METFKKGFSENYGVKLILRKLRTLRELEWPAFRVNWPSEGTLDLSTVRAVYQVVTRTPGYADYFLYVDTWLQTTTVVLPWVWFGMNRQGQSKARKEQEGASKVNPPREPEKELISSHYHTSQQHCQSPCSYWACDCRTDLRHQCFHHPDPSPSPGPAPCPLSGSNLTPQTTPPVSPPGQCLTRRCRPGFRASSTVCP